MRTTSCMGSTQNISLCILLPTVPAFDVHGRVEMGQIENHICPVHLFYNKCVWKSVCTNVTVGEGVFREQDCGPQIEEWYDKVCRCGERIIMPSPFVRQGVSHSRSLPSWASASSNPDTVIPPIQGLLMVEIPLQTLLDFHVRSPQVGCKQGAGLAPC